MKRCLSLLIREMKIETTIMYHCTPGTMAKIEKTDNISVDKDIE